MDKPWHIAASNALTGDGIDGRVPMAGRDREQVGLGEGEEVQRVESENLCVFFSLSLRVVQFHNKYFFSVSQVSSGPHLAPRSSILLGFFLNLNLFFLSQLDIYIMRSQGVSHPPPPRST